MFLGVPVETTSDLLNLALAVGFIVLVIFLSMVLVRVYKILGEVKEITETVNGIVDLVSHYLWKPVQVFNQIVAKVREFIQKKRDKI
jgi:uncharacterized protein YoxC